MYVDASRLTGPLATSASAKLASRKSGPFQVDSVTRGEDGSVTAVKLDLTLFGNKMADKHPTINIKHVHPMRLSEKFLRAAEELHTDQPPPVTLDEDGGEHFEVQDILAHR